jgi:hypothetical protein
MVKRKIKTIAFFTAFICGLASYYILDRTIHNNERVISYDHIKTNNGKTLANEIQGFGRNLSEYEIASNYDLWFFGNVDSERKFSDVRNFIWEHYVTKKKGYIRCSGGGFEGQVCVRHIFIEPTEFGNWRVSVISLDDSSTCKDSDCKTIESDYFDIFRIVPFDKNNKNTIKEKNNIYISPKLVLSPDKYNLVIKNNNDNNRNAHIWTF